MRPIITSTAPPSGSTIGGVADPCFEVPRLAALYDPLDPDRADLLAYLGMAGESLRAAGFEVDEVRGAPDRPGREFVFVARRAG